ncbi:MAG: exodeoxyribonuclease VII small subunit [Epulopiscium sp. Nuni2H_MBin003]|nr:MAG: exodeoxyribonuclease VII small subunit [Epulopiscium sp. Nuni2H_MBin003]
MAKKTFERSLQELEGIINKLEQGEITLDDTIKKYKQGMELANACANMLKEAEQQISIYEGNEFIPFNGGGNV